jgi:hypothetical protein
MGIACVLRHSARAGGSELAYIRASEFELLSGDWNVLSDMTRGCRKAPFVMSKMSFGGHLDLIIVRCAPLFGAIVRFDRSARVRNHRA